MKSVILMLCLCLSALASHVWAGDADAVLQERLHLATDRSGYMPGERVWVRAFMVDAVTGRPIIQSRYVHVELLDESSMPYDHVLLMEQDGIVCGYVNLPSTLPSGTYYLRAFTRVNANRPDLECIVPVQVGETTAIETTHKTVKADYEPDVWSLPDGDSTAIYISIPDDCVGKWSSMAVAVAADSMATEPRIARTLSRHIMANGPIMGDPEVTQHVSGQIAALHGGGFGGNAIISMIAPQADFFLTVKADKTGRFSFDNLELADSTLLIIQGADSKGRGQMILSVNLDNYPALRYPLAMSDEDYDEFVLPEGHILLDEIVVKGKFNFAEHVDAFSSIADVSFTLEQIKDIDATCLHELFRRIPGVYMTSDEHVIIRGRTSIYGESWAAIAIDGVIQPEDYDLDNVQMSDVARVDVFKTGSSMIWGADGGRGVISITTKTGNYSTTGKLSPNIKKVYAQGYQPYTPFSYQGSGKTLYWNPAVRTKGNSVLQFKVARVPHFSISIEGLTDEGKTIAAHAEFISQ